MKTTREPFSAKRLYGTWQVVDAEGEIVSGERHARAYAAILNAAADAGVGVSDAAAMLPNLLKLAKAKCWYPPAESATSRNINDSIRRIGDGDLLLGFARIARGNPDDLRRLEQEGLVTPPEAAR